MTVSNSRIARLKSPAESRMPANSARRSYSSGFRDITSAIRATARLKFNSRASFCAAFSLISSSCDKVPRIFRFLGGGGSFFAAGFATGFGKTLSNSGSSAINVFGRRGSGSVELGTPLTVTICVGGGGIGGSFAPLVPGGNETGPPGATIGGHTSRGRNFGDDRRTRQ